MLAMFADVVHIVILETAESTRVEMYEDYDYLCIAHTIRLASVALVINWSFDFSCCVSKNLQNSSAKQKISVTLSSENIAVRGCILFC